MATITIEYEDGTTPTWSMADDQVERDLEPILGSPEGMRC